MITPDWDKVIPTDFPDTARVWIYQNNRPFSQEEEEEINLLLGNYVDNWVSHNRPVKGWASVLFNQFILLMADDTMDRLCGSAVDDSVRYIRGLEEKFGLELLNRMNIGFVKNDELLTIPINDVEQHFDDGTISQDTLFFNNSICTKKELLGKWIQPIEESFLWKRVSKV